MKQFLVGSAFLMFISSLPADATNTHAISLKSSPVAPQKISFMQAFGDTLPPIGYVTFCREHRVECRPGRRATSRCRATTAGSGVISSGLEESDVRARFIPQEM